MPSPIITPPKRNIVQKPQSQPKKKASIATAKPNTTPVLNPLLKEKNVASQISTASVLKKTHFWQKWDSIIVELTMIPHDETTFNLWRNFEKFGSISYLEIFETVGKRPRRGKIRFSPPPAKPFWPIQAKRCLIDCTSEDELRHYQIEVEPKLRDPIKIQSPTNKDLSYDPIMRLNAHSLHFGIMIKPGFVMSLATVKDDLTLTLDLRRRQITVNFSLKFRDPRHDGKPLVSITKVGTYDRINKYMFRIPFGQLKTIQRSKYDSVSDLLIISLDCPPQFFRKREDKRMGHFSDNLRWDEFDTWFRQTDIMYDPYPLHKQKIALHKDTPDIDIGRWTTYVFRAEKPSERMKQALSDFNIGIIDIESLGHIEPRKADLWSIIDSPNYSVSSLDLSTLNEGSDGIVYLPFEVRYQLEVCISREILNEHNITRKFIQTLAKLASENLLKARSILEYVASNDKRVYDPMSIFADRKAMAFTVEKKIPHYCAFVRKATITPTTIYFSSPTVETTNRVLRHYSRENTDGRFLRVQFTDELSHGRINPCADKSKDDELFTRVYRTLYNGIQIGDRTFEFLAFGGSQFRENGAYFFCPTEHLSCNDIRQWMGNFSHIPVVAKYAARLGQCFSTTRAIKGLSKPDIVLVPDIEREYQDGTETSTYCFTDGVGKISPFLAQMIMVELGLRTKTPPSAFQFRLGGCKGILVVWPDAKDKEVHIRKSQQKFTAVYNGLEIIRCSRFSIATLNRQTITILSALGVKDDTFLQMLSDQLEGYQNAMNDDELAVNLLLRYIDDNHMTINLAAMIRNGFMAQKDPFVLSLLHLWRAWSIKLLKEKARIVVENGAFLFGCVDETGTLKGYTKPNTPAGQTPDENDLPEIFIQITDKNDPDQSKVIVGVCLIGRNPSLHPGDLRVVKSHGDDYFVIWDEKLKPKEWNVEPMNYSAPEPKRLNRPVQITDLMKFFVRYMKNDALRTIAPAHLANSDYLNDSVKDPICLELAALHSKAVDYVKSGEAAQMLPRLRPKKWPHFMERTHKPKEFQYHSKKILGKLYDSVEKVNFVPQWKTPFDQRILRRYDLSTEILKAAKDVKAQYDLGMRKIMNQQDIGTEFEIWSTFVLSKPRVGSDYKLQEVIAALSDSLKDQFKAVCIEKAGGKDFDILGPFVAAMYQVTKDELDVALEECQTTRTIGDREVPLRRMEPMQMPLISFPWLFEKELGHIATGISNLQNLDHHGLELLVIREPGQRKRDGTKHINSFEEDIVLNKKGDVVHRGEILDLFQQNDMEEFEGSNQNELEEEEEDFLASNLPIQGASDFKETELNKNHVLGDTGVEDVVPQTALDGLIPQDSPGPTHDLESRKLQSFTDHEGPKDFNDKSHSSSLSDGLSVVDSRASSSTSPSCGETNEDAITSELKSPRINDDENTNKEEILTRPSNTTAVDRLMNMFGDSESESESDKDVVAESK
ncbi:RNA-dependent RNA Polymerase [Blumeria hordei DH14]|uniref:RNA-dependent RNA polymerase n=1 Tax=Blumeria graminis f. sp. hordei (strain DH14) TaxID=546991 RepID=N1JFK2_BLUG1|nr:RNA-dependent RNA Polymerase [Blumeria hordei DH14]